MNHSITSAQRIFGFRYWLEDRGLCYYYLRVSPTKEVLLKRLLAEDAEVNLPDFGEVIASGFGEPPRSLISELRAQGADVY